MQIVIEKSSRSLGQRQQLRGERAGEAGKDRWQWPCHRSGAAACQDCTGCSFVTVSLESMGCRFLAHALPGKKLQTGSVLKQGQKNPGVRGWILGFCSEIFLNLV